MACPQRRRAPRTAPSVPSHRRDGSNLGVLRTADASGQVEDGGVSARPEAAVSAAEPQLPRANAPITVAANRVSLRRSHWSDISGSGLVADYS